MDSFGITKRIAIQFMLNIVLLFAYYVHEISGGKFWIKEAEQK